MGLVDKLTELDQYIWKQHEKVTNYCNKEYGWNKYDLARKMLAAETISNIGVGTYFSLGGFLGDNPTQSAIGAGLALIVGGVYSLRKKRLDNREEREINQILRSGATEQPTFSAIRPAFYLIETVFFGYLTSKFFLNQQVNPPESLTLSPEQYTNLGRLLGACVMLGLQFEICKDYFLDQIMTPPKKKKSVLKSLYEKATEKLQPAPVPQLVPIKPNRHQSIDNIVGGA